MNVYTDPRLLYVAGAMNALPDLPLDNGQDAEELRKTGTTSDTAGGQKTLTTSRTRLLNHEKMDAASTNKGFMLRVRLDQCLHGLSASQGNRCRMLARTRAW